jgi:hypothetical protein
MKQYLPSIYQHIGDIAAPEVRIAWPKNELQKATNPRNAANPLKAENTTLSWCYRSYGSSEPFGRQADYTPHRARSSRLSGDEDLLASLSQC